MSIVVQCGGTMPPPSDMLLHKLCCTPVGYCLVLVLFFQIQSDVLKAYVSAAGLFPMFWLTVAFLIYVASQIATSLWLGAWSDDPILNGTAAKQQSDYRITFYGVFGVGSRCALNFLPKARNIKLYRNTYSRLANATVILARKLLIHRRYVYLLPVGCCIITKFSQDLKDLYYC